MVDVWAPEANNKRYGSWGRMVGFYWVTAFSIQPQPKTKLNFLAYRCSGPHKNLNLRHANMYARRDLCEKLDSGKRRLHL